ncbi:MAG: glycosyltransferase family protein [Nanoarchaeota archaeon]
MKVAFGVFDWGLGHATRDTPLIEALLKRGHQVDIISTGRALKILQEEFKKRCNYFDVPSIVMPYKASSSYAFRFFATLPSTLKALRRSRKVCKKILHKEKYDRVISDMRLDLYDTKENSYLITHHFGFKLFPYASSFFEAIEKYIEGKSWHFKNILVLDEKKKGLTGKLGHQLCFVNKKKKIVYLGITSRIKKLKLHKDIDYFISISGPEPQRTLFEKKIFEQISTLKGKVIVTLGRPDKDRIKKEKNIKVYSYFNKKEQEEAMNRAKCIICYAGYSTMMEFCELGIKEALLLPQPTLPEQEYLADYYTKEKYFYHTILEKLDLKKDLLQIKKYHGFKVKSKTEETVKNFLMATAL